MLKILFEKKYGGQTPAETKAQRLAPYHYSPPNVNNYMANPLAASIGGLIKAASRGHYERAAGRERAAANNLYAQGLEQENDAIMQANEQDYQGDVARENRDFGLRQQQQDQKGTYMNSMLALKQKAIEQKAAQAAMKMARAERGTGTGVEDGNPFKGDPQAMSLWRGLKSAKDKRQFEQMYRKDRDKAFDNVEDVMKNKYGNIMSMGGIIGGKEPSGHYKMSKKTDPMKDSERVMAYNDYAKEVLQSKGDVPESIIRRGYDAYIKSYGIGGVPGKKNNVGRALGGH